MKRTLLFIIAGILLLLIFTNPSIKGFKDYLGVTSYNGLHKKQNWFICSVFESQGNEYLGVVGNIFRIVPHHVTGNFNAADSTIMDSAKMDSGLISSPVNNIADTSVMSPFIDDTVHIKKHHYSANNRFKKSLDKFVDSINSDKIEKRLKAIKDSMKRKLY